MAALPDVRLAREELVRVRIVGAHYVAEWRDKDGTLLAGIYREVCVELQRGEGDERHRANGVRSDLGNRCADALGFDWLLPNEEIEALTKLELEELPRDLLEVLTEIALDPKHVWSKAALRVSVVTEAA